jgi:hypothetical protein
VNKNDNRVLLLFIEIYNCNSYPFYLIFTVLNIPTTPKVVETERRSSLRVKTERKFYRPGDGVDGKWIDNPTSPSEEENNVPTHHAPVTNIAFAVEKPGYERSEMITDEDKTTKNEQDVINNTDEEEGVKKDYGMYVENLEYGSDETRSLTEDDNETFDYENFNETVKEEDDDDDTVGATVEE